MTFQHTFQPKNLRKGALALFTGTLILWTGCSDEGSPIGTDLLPKEEIIGIFNYDASPLQTENYLQSAIRSDDPGMMLLGELNDPMFGQSKADFVTQIALGTLADSTFNRFDGYRPDSVKLNLHYSRASFYGDTVANHLIKVYELRQDLVVGRKYYSNMDAAGFNNPADLLGERLSSAKDGVTDSAWTAQSNEHTWSITLKKELADRFFAFDKQILGNVKNFQQAFKGFYITSELEDPEGEGSLLKFNLLNEKCHMVMYYSYERKDKYNNIIDTVKYEHKFPFSLESVKVNRFSHNLETIDFATPSATNLYVQGMAGSLAKIDMAGVLDTWKDSLDNSAVNYGISTVDLIFEVDTTLTQYRRYPLPSELKLVRKNSKTGEFESPLFSNTSGTTEAAFLGGAINYTDFTYHFRFARGLFESVLNNDDRVLDELYLVPSAPESNFNRVILRSRTNSTAPLKLNIKYVKFEK